MYIKKNILCSNGKEVFFFLFFHSRLFLSPISFVSLSSLHRRGICRIVSYSAASIASVYCSECVRPTTRLILTRILLHHLASAYFAIFPFLNSDVPALFSTTRLFHRVILCDARSFGLTMTKARDRYVILDANCVSRGTVSFNRLRLSSSLSPLSLSCISSSLYCCK